MRKSKGLKYPDSKYEDHAEIKKQVDLSSGINRTSVIVFLGFLAYQLITLSSVNDLSLLLPNSKILFPLINIKVDLERFMIVGPLLILLLHLNLLVNLITHTEKLKHWCRFVGKEKARNQVHPFIYNQLLFRKNNPVYWCVLLFLNITIVFLPVGILWFYQIRFSDYQDIYVTRYHFILLVSEVLLVISFQGRLLFFPKRGKVLAVACWSVIIGLPVISGGDNIWISQRIANYTAKGGDRDLEQFMRIVPFPSIGFHDTNHVGLKLLGVIPFFEEEGGFLRKIRHRPRIDVSGNSIMMEEVDSRYVVHYMKDNGEGKSKSLALLNFGKGVDLKRRSLKFANFSKVVLPNSDFRKSHLEGSLFIASQLQGVNFENSYLTNCYFYRSNVNGGNFVDSKLDKAVFIYSEGLGLDMREALGVNSHFEFTNLTGSRFSNSNWQGVYFNYAVLDSSSFEDVDMRGASVINARMLDVNLMRCDLRASNLAGTSFDNVNITGGIMDGIVHSMCSGICDNTEVNKSGNLYIERSGCSGLDINVLLDYLQDLCPTGQAEVLLQNEIRNRIISNTTKAGVSEVCCLNYIDKFILARMTAWDTIGEFELEKVLIPEWCMSIDTSLVKVNSRLLEFES